ncbi:hypothetical protein PHLGIDRAFT_106169 [Phlebiopsis gigantea 11061_1 CR5-6]|uniref:Uncharacterized protein n=1 Tax=Phlebiopsis gigantea (strain 11061_1 CR5-6) TaxID=745531 RepID=A0A0C3RY78_PHLG1|nr:hypothetical protein PHLGIDRAFT_106169 [Phlebiopsis gigantea 11061_1 CR5-6]
MAEKDPTIRLRRAVKENNLFLVKRLSKRTDLRNPDPTHKRFTSLAWAAVLGHEETFEYLLTTGHDDREISRDADNNTVLILLADARPPNSSSGFDNHEFYNATLRMARLYYDRYPDTVDWANLEGKTAMHIAAMRGNEELVRMLCDLGGDLDLADVEGNTALHYASAWGHVQIIQTLIERGCQYNVRNNDGSTPSDYAYSSSTKELLVELVRTQYETNKKARRNVFAQAAARGNEWSAQTIPPPSRLSNGSIPRFPNGSLRMRSGSGTSRTTTTSDSGEIDNPSFRMRNNPAPFSTLSPPRNLETLPQHQHSPPYPSASSAGSNSLFSVPSPTPQPYSSLAPAPTVAPSLSPIASRMRERDAEAMEKYKLRQRSGSAATTSTDTPSLNGSAVSSNGRKSGEDDIASLQSLVTVGSVAPRRMLRPSASAAQLRAAPQPLVSPNSTRQSESRSRSGTDPEHLYQHSPSTVSRAEPSSPATPTQTSTTPLRPPLIKATLSRDSTKEKEFIGPSSDFARFPPPPAEAAERSHTPAILPRRLPFNLLSSHKHNGDHHHNPFAHKRNSSANSVASRIT